MDNFDERVREHAYRLWVEEGCPEGRSEVHWDKARDLVVKEDHHKPAAARAGHDEKPASHVAAPAAARAPTKRKAAGEPKPAKEAGAKRR